jgi:hypothetical protein
LVLTTESAKKGKFNPLTLNEGSEGKLKYSSTLSLTSAMDAWLMLEHGPFASGHRTRYPLYRRFDGLKEELELVQKISPTPGFNPRTVQTVVNVYTV